MLPYNPSQRCRWHNFKGPSTLATLFNHMWPRLVAGIFIPVGNHYFQALASTLQFVAQVSDRLWLVPATDSVCIHNIHVAATCRPSVLGSATMRGHMWLNKVASVLGPLGKACVVTCDIFLFECIGFCWLWIPLIF